MFTCSKCGKTFTLSTNLYRHQKFCKLNKIYKCNNCTYVTSRTDNLKRHSLSCKYRNLDIIDVEPSTSREDVSHARKIIAKTTVTYKDPNKVFMQKCPHCSRLYRDTSRYRNHLNAHMSQNNSTLSRNEIGSITLSESAINGHARVYDITPNAPVIDIDFFLNSMRPLLMNIISNLQNSFNVRARFIAQMQYVRSTSDETFLAHFTSSSSSYIFDFDLWFQEHLHSLLSHLETFTKKGSNWILNRIVNVELNLITTPLLQGGHPFPLPEKLRKSRAVINVNSDGNTCFLYSILSVLHYHDLKHSRNKIESYQHWLTEIKMDDIPLPLNIKDLSKFEKLNGIKVNVHFY